MKSLLLALVFAFSPQVLADDIDSLVEDMEFQPSADGLGTMFQQGQALTLAIDAMIWYIIHGGGRATGYQDGFLYGVKCDFFSRQDRSDVTTKCSDSLSTDSLADYFDSNARRQFHNTLSHLHDIRNESRRIINSLNEYVGDKTFGSRHTRCRIYGNHNDIKQDWPSFLSAYRTDRRAATKGSKAEMIQYFFAYVRRTYAVYTKAMNKLVPDLKKLCAAEND